MKIIKIKDDVDMKILLNYGFDLDDREWYSFELEDATLKIKPVSREIIVHPYNTYKSHIPGVLQELIIDGLTEVIEIEGD